MEFKLASMESSIWLNITASALILVMTVALAYLFNRLYSRVIQSSTRIIKNDPTNYKFLKHIIMALIYMVGISLAVYVVPSLKALAGSFLAGAGILAVSVGFASQHALSNIISGFFIVVFKPFKVNDRLMVREFQGTVEDITLRHTVIRDFENKRIVIPNTVISDEIIVNADFAEEEVIKWIEFNLTVTSNIDKAKEILRQEVLKHKNHIDTRSFKEKEAQAPVVPVRMVNINESGIVLRAWAWANGASEAFEMYCDVLESVMNKFKTEKDIELAFPQRSITLHTSPGKEE